MSRVAVMAAVLALLPPSCAKLTGKAPPVETEAPPPPPPPPTTSATTPPAWRPPEPVTSASTALTAKDPPVSADLVKARAAAEARDFKKVRALLEKKVRAGKCAPEESQLVFRACTALKDKPCIAEVKAKHPDDLTGE